MKYPWLFLLVLLAVFAAVAYGHWRVQRKSEEKVAWLANTEQLRTLPAYQKGRRRRRSTAFIAGMSLSVLALGVAVSAGAPVERQVEHPKLANRDIVLCLDASGSMLPYNGQILMGFHDMVDNFEGERLSLELWSAQTVVRFPLTDDYELVQEVLTEASTIINRGYLGPEGDYVLVTPELSDYLAGVDAPDGQEISSLIGDGLATCVLGFDQTDKERSRTIILATDNEVMGEQIYTLREAIEFASSQNVDIIALYPAEGGVLTAEGEQMRSLVRAAGGDFYDASDPAAVSSIVDQIAQQQLAELDGSPETVEKDRPRTALLWSLWGLLGFMVWAAVRKL